MNPPTTLTNHNPPATIGCGLNPNPIRREESDTPHDVDPDGVHAPSIEALYAAGITTGCTQQPLQYCPNRPVTRAQMAAFLHRARHLIATAHSTSSN